MSKKKVPLKTPKRQMVMVPIAELQPYKRNARTHTEKQIKQVIASIKEFGWTNPVLIDEKRCIIAGHARVEAAKRMGMTEVPCIILDGLTEAQKRAYVIADNKLALNAGWDEELLALEFKDLEGMNFDLGLTGFESEEIKAFIDSIDEGSGAPSEPVPIMKTATLEQLAPTPEERLAFEGRKILVEFSGGKDSSGTAAWARHFFPDAEIELCYADLGADHPGFNFFIHDFAAAMGCKLTMLRSKENIIEGILRRGKWPGHFHPFCHNFLHQALNDNLKENDPNAVITIRGGAPEGEIGSRQGERKPVPGRRSPAEVHVLPAALFRRREGHRGADRPRGKIAGLGGLFLRPAADGLPDMPRAETDRLRGHACEFPADLGGTARA